MGSCHIESFFGEISVWYLQVWNINELMFIFNEMGINQSKFLC